MTIIMCVWPPCRALRELAKGWLIVAIGARMGGHKRPLGRLAPFTALFTCALTWGVVIAFSVCILHIQKIIGNKGRNLYASLKCPGLDRSPV